MTNWPQIHLDEARGAWWRRKYNFRLHERIEAQRRVENNKLHFPSHHWSLEQAEADVRRWGALEGKAAEEVHRYAAAVHRLRPKDTSGIPATGEGVCTPKTVWNPYRRPIANWIARKLQKAHDEGRWHGYVTSGLRTFAKQTELWWIYQHGGNIAARPGQSNHEGYVYDSYKPGAVDVSNPEELANALEHQHDGKSLRWAMRSGLRDYPHFSKTGH